MTISPLIFEPIFKPRIWGGAKLPGLLRTKAAGDHPIGEAWVVSDLDGDVSVVARGPHKGKTLREMIAAWGAKLHGRASLRDGRFPLLLKFLDAREPLSVQVHPSESAARESGGTVRVKHEAWYVVQADSGACIYRGFRSPVSREDAAAAVRDGSIADLLERVDVRAGQCYYLPTGTVHALGGGVLVAEVQTPSDDTYRLYDWDRVDAATGQPRTLHVEEGLRSALLEPASVPQERKSHVASVWTTVTQLVKSEAFAIERVRMAAGVRQAIPYEEMVIWMVLEGTGIVRCDGGPDLEFSAGDTVLLPAALKDGEVEIVDRAMWLEVTVPIESSLSGFERPSPESHGPARDGAPPIIPLTVRGQAK